MGLIGKWVESLDYEYEILPSCTRNRSSLSKCEECVTSCPDEAISIVKQKPVISHEKCTECGICISACPVQAVAGIYPKRMLIQNQLVATKERPPTSKELLILYRKGYKEVVAETDSLLQAWNEPIVEANTHLKQMNKQPITVTKKLLKEKEESLSRREFFSFWKQESKSVLKLATPAKWRFNHEDFDLKKHYEDFQFMSISIDIEKCSLCTACQRMCEESCFEIKEDGFAISPQACTSCQLCAHICPEDAIKLEFQITEKNDKVTELPIYKNECSTCGKTFDTLNKNEVKCIICKKRELY